MLDVLSKTPRLHCSALNFLSSTHRFLPLKCNTWSTSKFLVISELLVYGHWSHAVCLSVLIFLLCVYLLHIVLWWSVPEVACHLYLSAMQQIPVLVRQWWNTIDRGFYQLVERYAVCFCCVLNGTLSTPVECATVYGIPYSCCELSCLLCMFVASCPLYIILYVYCF